MLNVSCYDQTPRKISNTCKCTVYGDSNNPSFMQGTKKENLLGAEFDFIECILRK